MDVELVRDCVERSRRMESFAVRSVPGLGFLPGLGHILAIGAVLAVMPNLSRAQAQEDVAPVASTSQSVGRPTGGRLLGGVALQDSDTLTVKRGSHHTHHGTAEIVQLIEQGAAAVAEAYPSSTLIVGDLSRPSGRRLRPHRSHQNGLDADIGFFLVDEEGNPAEIERFVNLGRNGCGEQRGTKYCLDAARTWHLLASLVANEVAAIQYVLINPALRALLISAGEEAGADEDTLARARTVTEPHSGSREHRSHMHLRIYCPVDDRPDCRDQAPFHAWYVGEQPPRERVASRGRRSRATSHTRRRAQRARSQRARARRAQTRQARAERAQRRQTVRRQARRMAQRAAARRQRIRRQAALRRRRAAARQGG